MPRPARTPHAAALGLLWATAGACALGTAPGCARHVRPEPPTVAAATQRDTCDEATAQGMGQPSPLIVDWRPESRGDLEVAMKEAIRVVDWSCGRVRVLPDCWVDGAYGFVGTSTKEEVVRFTDGAELRAGLPEVAARAGATLEAEFSRGASLDVALVMVGKRMSSLRHVRPDQLIGRCDGASHFVRGATVGAFAMNKGSAATARASAEVFGASASAKDSSELAITGRDGQLEECRASTPDASAPPTRCAAVLRLQLAEIDAPLPAAPYLASGDATPRPRSCSLDDAPGCERGCEEGDADACFMFGAILQKGRGVAPDPARANILYRKACDMAHQDACVLLAISYFSGPQYETGLALAERACSLNNAEGCAALAFVLYEGRLPDPVKAEAYARKACSLGNTNGCELLSKHAAKPTPTP